MQERQGLAEIREVGGAALLVGGRRSTSIAPLRAAASRLGLTKCRLIRGHGRQTGARERLAVELLEAGVQTVVVPSLRALHPSPARALELAASLVLTGVRIFSLEEAWLSTANATTLMGTASFLISEDRRIASLKGRKGAALLRHSGAGIGRPRRPIPVPLQEAHALVRQLGWRGAARAIGLSAASIRRALSRAGIIQSSGTEPQ